MPPSIHDNLLLGYAVQCEERRITLHTAFHEVEPVEKTLVVFGGVEAYQFENDVFGTILFGIESVDPSDLVRRERARFEEGRRWGWPDGWAGPLTDDLARLKERGVQAWEITSSIGLSGWVLAMEMTMAAVHVPG